MEPLTFAAIITPPSILGKAVEQEEENKPAIMDDEESSGMSWRMLLEFYALLDFAIFVAAIVLAVVRRKQKEKNKRDAEDNRDVSDIYIFIAVLWFPNIVCFLLNVINGYATKWLSIFQRWAMIRLGVLSFIAPLIILLLDAKEFEARICAKVFDKDLSYIRGIKAHKNFTLMVDVEDAFDSLHLMSLAPATEQQLRGFSPRTEEIFEDIELE